MSPMPNGHVIFIAFSMRHACARIFECCFLRTPIKPVHIRGMRFAMSGSFGRAATRSGIPSSSLQVVTCNKYAWEVLCINVE